MEMIRRLAKQKPGTLGVASLVGLAVVLQVYQWLRQYDEDPSISRYLVARRGLEPETFLQFQDFSVVTAKQYGKAIPNEAITDQEWHHLQGIKLKLAVVEGEILSAEKIAWPTQSLSQKIPRGYRAYSFTPVNDIKVMAGERIDVFLTPMEKDSVPKLLLENVMVLQIKRYSDLLSLVLSLTGSQIQILERGGQLGALSIALRNQQDESVVSRDVRSKPLPKTAVSIHTEAE